MTQRNIKSFNITGKRVFKIIFAFYNTNLVGVFSSTRYKVYDKYKIALTYIRTSAFRIISVQAQPYHLLSDTYVTRNVGHLMYDVLCLCISLFRPSVKIHTVEWWYIERDWLKHIMPAFNVVGRSWNAVHDASLLPAGWTTRSGTTQCRIYNSLLLVRRSNNKLFRPPGIVWSMTLTLDVCQVTLPKIAALAIFSP